MKIANLIAASWVAVLCLACGSNKAGDVPLTIVNPPKCAAGKQLSKQVVVRIESGSDYVQQGFAEKMTAPNTFAGRNVKVKVALCPLDNDCRTPAWAHTIETKVGGSDRGVSVEIPKIEVTCDDGSQAKY